MSNNRVINVVPDRWQPTMKSTRDGRWVRQRIA
jgi:hypothetical protein